MDLDPQSPCYRTSPTNEGSQRLWYTMGIECRSTNDTYGFLPRVSIEHRKRKTTIACKRVLGMKVKDCFSLSVFPPMLAAAIATFLLFIGMGFNRNDFVVSRWFEFLAYCFWMAAMVAGMSAEARRLSKISLRKKREIESNER
jgi:hypothetical protein